MRAIIYSLCLCTTLIMCYGSVRDPPYWYLAEVNGDTSSYLLPYTRKNLSERDYRTISSNYRPNRRRSQLVIEDDMTEALRYTIQQPYGANGEYVEACENKKCGPEHACIAPTGIARCLPLDCLNNPFNGRYTVAEEESLSSARIKPQVLTPLEWQFTPTETQEIVTEARKKPGIEIDNGKTTEIPTIKKEIRDLSTFTMSSTTTATDRVPTTTRRSRRGRRSRRRRNVS